VYCICVGSAWSQANRGHEAGLQVLTTLNFLTTPSCEPHETMTGSNLALSVPGALIVEGIKGIFTHNICAFPTILAPRPPPPGPVPVDERFPVSMVQRYPDGVSKWSVFVRKL